MRLVSSQEWEVYKKLSPSQKRLDDVWWHIKRYWYETVCITLQGGIFLLGVLKLLEIVGWVK